MKTHLLSFRGNPIPRTRCRAILFGGLILCLFPIGRADTAVGQAEGRFVWAPYRLREVATINNQLRQSRQTVLLKLDTATGKVWLYDPESLTLTADGYKDEDGHFRPIEVEGLPPWPPPESKPARGKKETPPKLESGRFGFTVLSLPRTVRDVTGDRRGVAERDELFLTDKNTGLNWIFKARSEKIKEKEREITLWHNRFTRLFNADEMVLVEGDPRGKPPEKSPYLLKRSAAEWMELFMAHREGKTLQAKNAPSIDAVIVLSKDDSFTPLVVLRKKLEKTRAVGVSPWQAELYSDTAVDWLCRQPPVDFDEADRYLIFITTEGRTARGFNPLQTHTIGGMPDHDRIGKLLRVD